MNRIINCVFIIASLLCGVAFGASNSSPNLYYGEVPSAAQWNSYFASKLDFTPGAANTMGYWDGSGNFLNAPVSGDCTAVANVFTCLVANATNANNVTVTNDTTTNATMYPLWVTATTGSLPVKTSSSKLSFNPSTGNLSATAFSGAGTGLTGTASGLSIGGNAASAVTATTATNIAGGTQYGVLYQSASGVTATTAAGTSGYVLTSNGTSAPTYQSSGSAYNPASVAITGGTIGGTSVAGVAAAGAATPYNPSSVGITGGTITSDTSNSTISKSLNGKLLFSATAPTIASGFGVAADITNANGTAAFTVNVGTNPGSSGTITMPAASNGWACQEFNYGFTSTTDTMQSASSPTSISITNTVISTGALSSWANNASFMVTCVGF